MAITAGDIYVRSGATGAFTSVEYVQGGWTTVASSSNMTSIDTTRLRDGQIIWVESEEQLYLTRKFIAFETPGYSGTDDSASFSETNLGISGGGGSGDITNVIAGLGLTGGSESGDATLTLDTSSQHFIDAVNDLAGSGGIFAETGSFQSTTNNLEITGSLEVGGGLFKLTEFTTLPTAEEGAIAYSASNFYFGFE